MRNEAEIRDRDECRTAVIDLRRKAARRWEDAVGLQHPEVETVLQNISMKYNEVN